MKLKRIVMIIFMVINLNALSVNTEKDLYLPNESINVILTGMLGDNHDWIAIYPKDSSNDWINVIDWTWTDGLKEGLISLKGVPVGEYQVRVFFENSYTLELAYDFSVNEALSPVELSLEKENLNNEDMLTLNFSGMLGDDKDWIGIYPKGSSNAWENMISWSWTDGKKSGQFTFPSLDKGEYEARVFFENSFTLEHRLSFSVELIKEEVVPDPVVLVSNKEIYTTNELIFIDFKNMLGVNEDWIGVYPKGSSYEFENVITWTSTRGKIDGEVSLYGLPVGEYDVRAFFNNSLTKEANISISVEDKPVESTIYEDAEGNLSDQWIHVSGDFIPLLTNRGFESDGAVALVTQWTNNATQNIAEYHLPLNNSTQKVLEMDIGGVYDYLIPNKLPEQIGYMSHFSVGVEVVTLNGTRRMVWDSFLNHGDVDPYIRDYGNGNIWIYYPSPVEHVRGWYEDIHTWQHFKVNIEYELRKLEPDNKVVTINYFIATGGFLDNIKLSSH